jgi:hypothetical protein
MAAGAFIAAATALTPILTTIGKPLIDGLFNKATPPPPPPTTSPLTIASIAIGGVGLVLTLIVLIKK